MPNHLPGGKPGSGPLAVAACPCLVARGCWLAKITGIG